MLPNQAGWPKNQPCPALRFLPVAGLTPLSLKTQQDWPKSPPPPCCQTRQYRVKIPSPAQLSCIAKPSRKGQAEHLSSSIGVPTVRWRWGRLFLFPMPHSLVTVYVSSIASPEVRGPLKSLLGVACRALRKTQVQHCSLSSSQSPERTPSAGSAALGVLFLWEGVV